jgi:uncharacterized protein
LAKPTGAVCNLACEYCFFLDKELLYPDSSFRMSDEVLETYIRQLIEAHRTPQVTVAWQGGEPTLMGVDFYRRAIELQKKHGRPGMTFENTMQTNGTLLDDEWCEFLKENDFLIGISIDGPAELHDAYRVDKKGRPTFERVMKGLRLLQKYEVEHNILVAVNRKNADHPLDVYRFLRDEAGATWMQFIPVVERINEDGLRLYQEGTSVSERSVTPEQFGRFLIQVFDEWVRNDVGKIFVQTFEATLRNWMGLPSSGMCQWRSLLVRPFRGAQLPVGQYPRNTDWGTGRWREAAQVRTGQTRFPSARLPGVRRALCLPRGMPQEPVPRHARW